MSTESIERLRGAVCHALNEEAILFPGAGASLSASGILTSSASATNPATDVTISTGGNRTGGIWGLYTEPEGDPDINVRGAATTTVGDDSLGMNF